MIARVGRPENALYRDGELPSHPFLNQRGSLVLMTVIPVKVSVFLDFADQSAIRLRFSGGERNSPDCST